MAFTLTAEMARFLQSPAAKTWLARAETLPLTPASHLRDVQSLRKSLSPALAAAVVEQTLLRRRAAEKFSRAAEMLFVRDALEQSTREPLARHRARRFAPFSRVADIGCGIGGDSIALAGEVSHVFAVDIDRTRLEFAAHNAAVYDVRQKIGFAQADGLWLPAPSAAIDAVFADPARRSDGKRTFNPKMYRPPPDELLRRFGQKPLGVKLAPGIDFSGLPPHAEIEIVSFGGEAKEAVLWLNGLAMAGVSRRATVLPAGETITDAADDVCAVGAPGAVLCEPDAAVIRAGLVKQVGARLGLHLLDEHIAYLSGDVLPDSSLVRCYHIEAQLPLKVKAINRYARRHHIRRLNVKQRGTGLAPEKVASQLKLAKEGTERTLILMRVQSRHIALIVKRDA